ncbi:hypothetical protein RclHR1_21480004 [Rhizophagus clarus]|uniref:F-box domain-containing protein n=1 Tax=Rhizophagus clarus TaxID=94130 RepID=A0A2Z6RM29_9GLOM|nr:hypothetical protein RclHR1_21480004 [Rhizophagus clarus]
MTTSIVGLEDIIDEVKKNIKMVFQNGVRAEDRQKLYIIGLQLTLDRLARDTGFSDKTLNRIAESYPNLKYLNLGIYYHERKDDTGLITDKGLYAIANSCYKLEYLDISFRIEFSEESICNIIHSCLKLQALHIHGCRITYKTIRETRLYLKLKYFGLSRGWNRSNYS